MLGAIAAVALLVGALSATVSVTRDDVKTAEKAGEPVVEVRVVEGSDSTLD